MALVRHAHSIALFFSSVGLFVSPAACSRPDADEGSLEPPDGFSRYPAGEVTEQLSPNNAENPWLAGFGGASPSEDEAPNEKSNEGSAPGVPAKASGGSGADDPELGPPVEPDGQEMGDETAESEPLLGRRLERYLEGEGSDKLLGLWGEAGTSPVECRIEIYSNGGVAPWRTIHLPNEFPEDGSLTFCSIPADHPECTESLSGSLYNGNDALVLSCGEVIMDSFGRVGEDPGEAWTSEDQSLRSEGQDLARCGQMARVDPFAPFNLDDEWTRIENDEGPEEARQRCALSEAPNQGGAGAYSL